MSRDIEDLLDTFARQAPETLSPTAWDTARLRGRRRAHRRLASYAAASAAAMGALVVLALNGGSLGVGHRTGLSPGQTGPSTPAASGQPCAVLTAPCPSRPVATLPPFDSDATRRVLLPRRDGRGGEVVSLPVFRGDFEIQIGCVGGGQLRFSLYGDQGTVPCDGTSLLDDVQTTGSDATLVVRADGSQHWRILIQAGHTPISSAGP